MTEDIECPRCGESTSIEIEELEEGSISTECENCGATLDVSYTVSVEITDVTVEDGALSINFDCPKCDNSIDLEISEEDGAEEVECDVCHSTLEANWSDWGKNVNVEILSEEDDEDDDDEDI